MDWNLRIAGRGMIVQLGYSGAVYASRNKTVYLGNFWLFQMGINRIYYAYGQKMVESGNPIPFVISIINHEHLHVLLETFINPHTSFTLDEAIYSKKKQTRLGLHY